MRLAFSESISELISLSDWRGACEQAAPQTKIETNVAPAKEFMLKSW
jgi:hypothetical protein